MSLSIYQASIPTFLRTLGNLSAILKKAAAHAEAKNIDPRIFIDARLAPDMFPLARQGEHVRRQPGVDEDARIDVLRFGVGGGFLQDRREVAEGAQEGRDRSLVDRQGHGRAPDRG